MKFKNTIIYFLVFALIAISGIYFSYNKKSYNSGVINDIEKMSDSVVNNKPVIWSSNMCDHFPLDVVKSVLGAFGKTAYLPKTGFSENVCVYKIDNGDDDFIQPSVGLAIMFKDFSKSSWDITKKNIIKAGGVGLSVSGFEAVLNKTSNDNSSLSFFKSGVYATISIKKIGTLEEREKMLINLAKEITKFF